MQTSQLKCIHPQHFVKKYEKRQELCNATPVNTYSIHILCCCLRLPKKKKTCFAFRAAFRIKNNIVFMLHDYTRLQTSSFYDSFGFYFFFTFCVVIPQRSETVVVCVTCIVHALVMTLLIFFCLDTLFHPAKYKEQLGSKVRPMYSLLPFRLQQCSARDAYCAVCPFYLELRHYIFTAIKDTSSSCQWHGT